MVNKQDKNEIADNKTHCSKIMSLVDKHFGGNLEFAFICGSRAKGTWKSNSDVDIFVVIKDETNANLQLDFFNSFRDYHDNNGLNHDHCGEVLSSKVLDHLLYLCTDIFSKIPTIQEACCYSCLFSKYRKARVIAGMLSGPKVMKRGSFSLISKYTNLAKSYFDLEKSYLSKEMLGNIINIPKECPQKKGVFFQNWVQSFIGPQKDYSWTPVGIRLDLWFDPNSLAFHQIDVLNQCNVDIASDFYENKHPDYLHDS